MPKPWSGHYQAKGYGLYKIKNELYRRRVPKAYWEDALAEMDDAEEAIDAFLAKKLRDPEDRKECKKASDALARRAFPGLRSPPASSGGNIKPTDAT